MKIIKKIFVFVFLSITLWIQIISVPLKSNYIKYVEQFFKIEKISSTREISTLLVRSTEIDVKKILLGFIDRETHSIQAALYLLTNSEIINALLRALKRGVQISIVLDKEMQKDQFNKIINTLLKTKKIKVYVYNGGPWSCMHHKFFLFGNNFFGKKWFLTGSGNSTICGFRTNRENFVFGNEVLFIKKLNKEFLDLQKNVQTKEIFINSSKKLALNVINKLNILSRMIMTHTKNNQNNSLF